MPKALSFLVRIALAILGLLWFYINSSIICLVLFENRQEYLDRDHIKCEDYFE